MKATVAAILITFFIVFIIYYINRPEKKKTEEKAEKKSNIVQQQEPEKIMDSNVYDDINLFKLEGIKLIKQPISYPYIKIEERNNHTKRIVYKRGSKDSIENIYQKDGIYWTTSYEYKADTGYLRVHEYITPDRIIELEYGGTWEKQGYHLHDASLIQRDSMITFGFGGEKGIKINPDPNNFEILKKTAKTFFIDKILVEKNRLVKIWTRIDNAHGYRFYSDTSCFEANNHSWFWWRYFRTKKIECN